MRQTAIQITGACDLTTPEFRGAESVPAKWLYASPLLLLTFLELSFDFGLEDHRFGGSDVLAVDPSIATDDERDRESEDSTVEFAGFCVSHHHGIVHVKLLGEWADRIDAVVHRDSDDLQSLICIIVLEFDEVRNFLAAGSTPRCPEIQQDNFAPIRRKLKRFPIKLRKREIGRDRILFRAIAVAPAEVKQSERGE